LLAVHYTTTNIVQTERTQKKTKTNQTAQMREIHLLLFSNTHCVIYSILSGSLYCTHVRMIYSSLLYDSINSDEKVNSQHERATTISPYYTVSVENSRLKIIIKKKSREQKPIKSIWLWNWAQHHQGPERQLLCL
jgi:hypothetical protein